MARIAMKMSDKGRFMPFFFSEAESSPAFRQSNGDISIYFKSDSIPNILFFSSPVFVPWTSSKRTIPQAQTESSLISFSRLSPISECGLKNSIHILVSTNTPLSSFSKQFLPLFFGFHLKFFFLLPIIINLYLSSERKKLLDPLLPYILFHSDGDGPCLRLFAGKFLHLRKEIVRYV